MPGFFVGNNFVCHYCTLNTMPELPEVETTRAGIAPHVEGKRIKALTIRQRSLRWPVEPDIEAQVEGQVIGELWRRGKYLLIPSGHKNLMIHLGMSGSLRIVDADEPPGYHDHFDILLHDRTCLRYRDPRRFGSLHLLDNPPLSHALLSHLGPEPLAEDFTAEFIYAKAKGRKIAVKPFLMDSKVVVGVGNIYATEALFMAGISPSRSAGRISLARYAKLVDAVKEILAAAIQRGGTTLRDFVGGDGNAGYFANELSVYGRDGKPCVVCQTPLELSQLGQRATVFCKSCQR